MKDTQKVFEPSCGDGNFVEEAIKAKLRAKELGVNSTTIVNSDFFHYLNSNKASRYDAVLGNPPFIRYQSFPEEHRELAISMMQNLGLKPNKLTNIWVPFLVISASLLKSTRRLAMVIPAELFQVKYAAETRVFLSNFSSK